MLAAGTVVYEGWLDGRPVAVKRLLRQFYDLARKEIQVGRAQVQPGMFYSAQTRSCCCRGRASVLTIEC